MIERVIQIYPPSCVRVSGEDSEGGGLVSPNLVMGGRFGSQRKANTQYRLFLQGNHTKVDAQVGATAQLHCTLTGALADGMVGGGRWWHGMWW